MKISIIIPSYNRIETLPLTLESIAQQDFPCEAFEVIVIDQSSSDGTIEYLNSTNFAFPIKVVNQPPALGASTARNQGIEISTNDLLIFVDSDLILDSQVISSHVECHLREKKALVCGRVLPYPKCYRSYIEKAANPDQGMDRGPVYGSLPFYQAFSTHLSIQKSTINEIGFFDVDLRSFEDIDFAYRAQNKGVAIINCPQAIGYHNHSRTIQQRLMRTYQYNLVLPMLIKRYPNWVNEIPDFLSYHDLNWKTNSPSEIISKIRVRFFGSTLIKWLFQFGCDFLEKFHLSPRFAKFFYYRLLLNYGYRGFVDGKKLLK